MTALLNVLMGQSGAAALSFGNVVMIAVGVAIIAVAVMRHIEPLLLAGLGFACIIANVPLSLASGSGALAQDGGLFHYAYLGIAQQIIPPLIFLGLGAMTDFSAVIANPRLTMIGAGAQLGVFAALVLATVLGFTTKEAGAIGILGAADGPLALFAAPKLAPNLLGPASVIAYASMALLITLQPRAMRLLTAGPERHRAVTRLDKIAFPIVIAIFFNVLFPQVAPLMTMLMLGNLIREAGPAARVSRAALGFTKALTVVLAVALGSSMAADTFLTVQTGQILLLALAAFACAAVSSVAAAKLMNLALKTPAGPAPGPAHIAPALLVKRGFKIVAQHETSNAILVHHAMGQNLAGVFGAAISGAIILAAFGGQQPFGQIAPGRLDSALAFSLLAFLLTLVATFAIGLIVAAFPLLNRLGLVLSGKSAHRKPEQADLIPDRHVAVISAAVAAIMGPHRIVHIEPAHQGLGWQAEGRAAHHGSHAIFHPGASQRQPENEGNRHGTEIQNHGRRPRI
jgi:oxaloacetate decarboxylase beta subunit